MWDEGRMMDAVQAEDAVRREAERRRGRVVDEPWGDRRRRGSVHAGPGLDDPASLAADAREARIDRVTVLHAQITAATREFLAAVAACDRHRDYEAQGFGSCAEWLVWRLSLKRNAASERVRVARALERLPQTSEAMGRGELSFSKVRALTRVATPDTEAELLDFAQASSTANLERMVRAYKTRSREDETKRERLLHGTRRFSVAPDEEGMYVVRGRLMPEVAAVLMRAVEAASDALYRSVSTCEGEEVEPAQRRADALGLLAERALAAGFGFGGRGGGDEDQAGEASQEVEGEASQDEGVPISGSRAERYQVVLHVEAETLRAESEPGRSELEDGTRIAAETARRLSCDASVVEITHAPVAAPCGCEDGEARREARSAERGDRAGTVDGGARSAERGGALSAERGGARSAERGGVLSAERGGVLSAERGEGRSAESDSYGPGALVSGCMRHGYAPILDVGRRSRTVTMPLRRALEARDRGCRFPGCGLRFTDAHHIRHWADGGETTMSNLVLLCGRHHRRVHEEGWRVCSDRTGARVVFFTPSGRPLADAPPPLLRDDALSRVDREDGGAGRPASSLYEQLVEALAERGVKPDWRTNLPTCRRDHEIPWALEARARDALDQGDAPDQGGAPDRGDTPGSGST